MFQELYAVARHTPFTMIITPQGERLSVIIQPRPTGDAEDRKGLAAPIKAVGTPEELDAELPAKLREYAERVNDVRATIDLPIEAVDAERKKASKKADRAAKRAAAKKENEEKKAAAKKARADAAAKRKAEAEAKNKAAADKRAKTLAAKKKAKSGIALPGAAAAKPAAATPVAAKWPFPIDKQASSPAPAPAKTTESARHRIDLPGKPECIRDYQQLRLKHGDKLTRRMFIRRAETSRRYEKLWKNWEAFVREACAQQELQLKTDQEQLADADRAAAQASTTRAVDSAPASSAEPGSSPGARSSTATAEDLVDDTPPRKGHGKGTSTDVYDEQANYLSSITTKPELGKHIGLAGHGHLLRITAIDERPGGGLDVTVVPDPEYTREHAEKIAAQVRDHAAAHSKDKKSEAAPGAGAAETEGPGSPAPVPAPASETKPYKVYDDGSKVIAESKYPYTLGEKIELDGDTYRIYARVNDYYRADIVLVWKVWNQADEVIGTIDHKPSLGEKIDVGEHKGLTVVDVDDGGERNCTAILVRPRAKPVAAPTNTTVTE